MHAVLTHRQTFHSGQPKKKVMCASRSGVGGRFMWREGSCVNSQDFRNFLSGSIGGEGGVRGWACFSVVVVCLLTRTFCRRIISYTSYLRTNDCINNGYG